MRALLKTLKITAILIFTISIMLFSASLFLQDRVAGILLKSLNNILTTRLDIGSFRLSFLNKFPRASLELKDVLVHSSPYFDQLGFPGFDTDTLLAAASVSIEFSISDILRGNYYIDRIGIKSGKLILLSDRSGYVNYEIKTNKDSGRNSEFEVDLERINLTDISATYYNLATKLLITGGIESGRLKSKISNDNIDFSANSSVHISLFQLNNTRITKGLDAELDISLYDSGSKTLFRKGILKLDDFVFGLTGTVSDDNFLDLDITGQNINITKVRKYLPDSLRLSLSDYDPSGILKVNASIEGVLSRTLNPHIEITALLSRGHIEYGRSDISIDDLSLSGIYSNGPKNLPETSNLTINNISLKLGSSRFAGSFNLIHFDHPEISIALNGILNSRDLKEFFNLKSISKAEGSIDLDLKLGGRFIRKEKYSITDFLDLKPEADFKFNSFSLGMENGKFTVDNVNGNINATDTITANNLSLTYNNHIIKIDGKFRNLPGWIAGNGDKMIASADVSMDRFDPLQFFPPVNSNSSTLKKRPFSMPKDMILDLNFYIGNIHYKTFRGEKFKGNLNYKPNALNFKSLYLNSLGGFISGTGTLFQNSDKSVIAKGIFNLEGIDINNAFITFNNFGQDFLKAENLAGTLSGSLSLLLPMDAFLKPQIKSLTAEGKYIVTKGALINFDPVKRLSSYIELSELENISFEKLENDFFIRNNFLYIPQMDVKSSAVDLAVNGKHSFDNDYVYHVKMLLSEILSKKFRKNRRGIQSEFGSVEDDGLGRTSLLLKIESKGEDVKVGYDMKAATNEIKKDIKEERQSLKTILNEEYGMFKNDTSLHKKEEKRPRFRITWDESGDSVKTIPEIPAEKKSTPLKNLFKKK